MFHTDNMRTEPACRAALKAAGLDRVEDILTRTDGKIVAWSRTTDSTYIPAPNGGIGFYVKRYFYPTWARRFRGFFRGTFFGTHRAKAEARALHAMRELGVPAVRPVAYGWRRCGYLIAACFLITEDVPGAPNLTTFAQAVQSGETQLAHRQRMLMIERLAEMIARLHRTGFAHGRLFWRNVLVRWGPTAEPEFFLLDSEPPKRIERLGRGGRWWLWELAKMATSAIPFTTRTERLRFMRHYFGIKHLTADAKEQIGELSRMARQWCHHEQQRIRMNSRFVAWSKSLAAEESAAIGSATTEGAG